MMYQQPPLYMVLTEEQLRHYPKPQEVEKSGEGQRPQQQNTRTYKKKSAQSQWSNNYRNLRYF